MHLTEFGVTIRAMADGDPQLPALPGIGYQLPAVYIIGLAEMEQRIVTSVENLKASVDQLASQLATDVGGVNATLDSELTQIHDALVALQAQVQAGQVDAAAVDAVTAQVDALRQSSTDTLGQLGARVQNLYEDASAPEEPPAEPPAEPV